MKLLDLLADSVNPALAIAAIVAAVFEWREHGRRDALTYVAATAPSIAAIYAVMFLDRRFALWHRYGADYSTHTAFATALVASMFIWRARWRPAVIVVWLAYLALILTVGYHTLGDILTAAAVGLAMTLPWQLAARRSKRRGLASPGSPLPLSL